MATAEKRSGNYSTRVSLTNPDTGTRIQKRVTARTKRDLDAAVAQLKTAWNTGTYFEPNNTPLGEYVSEWATHAGGKPITQLNRNVAIRLHIAPSALGKMPLGRVRPLHVQQFVNALTPNLAPSSARQVYSILRHSLNRAVALGMMASSPCINIELPRLSSARVKAWDDEQTRRFIHGVDDEPFRAFWIVAVTVGLRRGELHGLRWRDVDLERGTVTIRRTLTRLTDGTWIIGDSGKSDAAHRTVRLPRIAIDALIAHRSGQVARRNELHVWSFDDAVFDRGDGAHLTDATRLQRQYRRIVDRLDLPDITVHGLRHTAATNALRVGVPVHAVARMLGHADASVTLRTYSHVLVDLESESVDRIDALFVTKLAVVVTNS